MKTIVHCVNEHQSQQREHSWVELQSRKQNDFHTQSFLLCFLLLFVFYVLDCYSSEQKCYKCDSCYQEEIVLVAEELQTECDHDPSSDVIYGVDGVEYAIVMAFLPFFVVQMARLMNVPSHAQPQVACRPSTESCARTKKDVFQSLIITKQKI